MPDVSAEFVMDIAKILATSTRPLESDDVARCFVKRYSAPYLNSALNVCCQLGLATERDRAFVAGGELQSEIKRASREELYIPFQGCLRRYPPFLLYVDFASKGYTSQDAAAHTRGILDVRESTDVVENSLRRWGVFSKLVQYQRDTGKLMVKLNIEHLSADYVMRLLGAFQADLNARIFLIDMLGPEVFANLIKSGVGLDDLATALLDYEVDSIGAAAKATKTLELVLWRMAESSGIDLSETKGLMEVADELRKKKEILVNQLHIAHGLGGIRNMVHHDPDKSTGEPWYITKQGALLTTLLVPTLVRSLYLYRTEKKQVF